MGRESRLGSLLLAAVVVLAGFWAQAQTFRVLHAFAGPEGGTPYAGVIQDAAGNLYGTTFNEGVAFWGTVFKLDPTGNLTVLHQFTGGPDGGAPEAELVLDSSGNLYGTASEGASPICFAGCGTVFGIDKNGSFNTIYTFTDGFDGEPVRLVACSAERVASSMAPQPAEVRGPQVWSLRSGRPAQTAVSSRSTRFKVQTASSPREPCSRISAGISTAQQPPEATMVGEWCSSWTAPARKPSSTSFTIKRTAPSPGGA